MSLDGDPHHAHVVVASVKEGESARAVRNLLVRLMRALGTKGAFSVAVNRQQGFALLCGFELEEDADRLAAAVGAMAIGKYRGWKSQRGFKLDGRTNKRIAAVLKEAGYRTR